MAEFLNVQVHVLESKNGYQSEFLAAKMPNKNLLGIDPWQTWSNDWLIGYTLYMQQNFYIDIHDFENVLKVL